MTPAACLAKRARHMDNKPTLPLPTWHARDIVASLGTDGETVSISATGSLFRVTCQKTRAHESTTYDCVLYVISESSP